MGLKLYSKDYFLMTNFYVTDSSISNIMSPMVHKVAVLCDALTWHLHE